MIGKLRSRLDLDDHIAQLDELIDTLISRVDAIENRLENATTVEKDEATDKQRERLLKLYEAGAISAHDFLFELYEQQLRQSNPTNQTLP